MGDEVARLSARSADGKVVIDKFFQRIGDVIEYQTAVSVITARSRLSIRVLIGL
jgi:hypothetical protein